MKSCQICSALCHDKARFCPSCGAGVEEAPLADADPYLGLTLMEKYQLKRLLGEGGMGRVYLAEHLALEKPVAVKILHQHLLGDERSVARFSAEAREASRLNHPNVVTVMEFGETEYGVMFLVMEYLRGRPLSDLIADEYPFPFELLVSIFRQILLAVGEAHRLGVLHRDLKPDNVFLEPLADGTELVKVIDFGIAKRFDQEGAGLTSPGMVCGTPEYMSPEQVQGETLDQRSDVYALGILLYEMIVGTPPFFGGGPAEIMIQHAEDDPIPPSEAALELSIPPSLDAIVLWAMAKSRSERIESAEEFRRVLDSWLLVSSQSEAAPDEIHGSTCPSCSTFYLEQTDICPACGYQLPVDQPQEGTQYLIESLGAEQVNSLRSQRLPKATVTVDGLQISFGGPTSTEALALTSETIARYLPLVGRDQEVATLLKGVQTGGPLRLVGEAGLGKSRLLDELASRARDAEHDVIRVAPRDESYWPSPLWPVKQLVAELVGCSLKEMDSPERLAKGLSDVGAAEGALAGITDLLGLLAPHQQRMDRPARRRESFAALRDLVVARMRARPLAILLEDLDEMDSASQRYIGFLQSLPIHQSLLLVVTQAHPPVESDTIPTVALSGLGRADAQGFALLKQNGLPLNREAEALLEVTGGNPFFIDQLVRLTHEGALPNKVVRRIELVDARLNRLPMHLRELLQRIAVHGGRVPFVRLERAFSIVAEQLDDRLSSLETMGLVRTGVDWVSASHPLLEDAVLAGMPAEIRAEAHRHYLAINPLTVRSIGAAVRHALGGGDDRTQAELLHMGAGVAYEHYDNAKAIQWLQLALQKSRLLWGCGDGGMDSDTLFTVELGRALSDVLFQNGDRKTADAVLREVQQFVSPAQPALAAAVLMDQAKQVSRRGQLSSAEELLQEALTALDSDDQHSSWLRCELLYRQGEIAAARGGDERALSLFAEGFSLAEGKNHTGNGQSWRFQLGLGELARNRGDLEDTEGYLSNALMAADEAKSLVGTLHVQIAYSDLLFRQKDTTRATDHLGDAVRCAQRLGDRGMAAQLSLQLGEISLAGQDMVAATDHLRRAVMWGRAVGRSNVSREARRLLEQLASAGDGPA
jgi:eukaryotic-like serine/threonine-protein kinase